jgi:hypothetical protein
MTCDPGHEYYDVQVQLYGPLKDTDPGLFPIANFPRDLHATPKPGELHGTGISKVVRELVVPPVQTPLARSHPSHFALANPPFAPHTPPLLCVGRKH